MGVSKFWTMDVDARSSSLRRIDRRGPGFRVANVKLGSKHRYQSLLTSAATIWFLSVSILRAAEKPSNPDYPRVNVATSYEVDPSWPRRQPGMPWGHVPGIAVDREDNVWVFTRTNPPVQVFTADGRFVRAWGEGIVGSAHHIKIDRSGNIWLADIGFHVVRKCTPEGKVLLTIGTPGSRGE